MGGKAKPVVKGLTKPSSLAALALGPLGFPIIGGNIAGEFAGDALAGPDLPEPPEERDIEQAIEPGADQAQKLLRDRRARRRRQTPTILTSPLGANPSPTVSRTTLGGV